MNKTIRVPTMVTDPRLRRQLAVKVPPRQEKKTAPTKPEVKRKKVIAVDFDGTLCKSRWPKIGEPNTDLIDTLLRFRDKVELILWTTREDESLAEALEWCGQFGLTFDAVNTNTESMIDLFGTNPRKIGADFYIDDKALPWWDENRREDLCRLLAKL